MIKIISWIKQNKKKLFLISIIILIVLGALYLILNKKTPILTTPKEPLKLVATIPASGEYRSIWPVQKVKFIFDEQLDPKTTKYTIRPHINSRLIITEGPSSEMEILPIDGWKADTEYTITVSRTLTSVNGKQLEKDITYKIKRSIPQPGDPEYPSVIEDER